MMIRIFGMTLLSVFLAFSTPASSQTAPPQSEWINALRDGGYVIVFRHGATYQDQADTDPLDPEQCRQAAPTQRRWPGASKIDRRVDA
jgi:hypothetical protein